MTAERDATCLHAPRPEHATWLALLRAYLAWMAASHLLWEIVQLPLYTIWTEETLAYNVFAVVHCTAGDVIIAGASVAIALVTVGSGAWPKQGFRQVTVLATAIGAVYTMYSEWLNTGVRAAWTYTDAMPVVPGLGTGAAPLAQWLVLPPLGLWLCLRWTCSSRPAPDTASGRAVR